MAAPRSTSLRALRLLSQQNSSAPASTLASMAPFRRFLHITGAYSAQPASGPDVTSIYRARSVADLRAECERRNLRAGGSKAELVDRLANHDFLQTRAFSIAMKRIDGPAFGRSSERQFNTSRGSKAVNDSSPVDFVFMPRNLEAETAATSGFPRMPVPPDAYAHFEAAGASGTLPMKPQIYSIGGASSDGSEPSPMAEVVDNYALEINPYNLTETVNRSRLAASSLDAAKSQESAIGVKGMIKGLWNAMLDDALGPKQNSNTQSR
ncbi:uncharacterized protein CIMG_04141 [Coccidioides immitis RS]|uniref:SAP domain-containing protein n=4 Tax=Coccidioides TaxID=5500 RepID=J3KCV7_COCIM|nr:uncharacterized protein CIMG_04141 [Coccidioides immitis RS]XP_003068248.1 SAP domain containing protein [Coccidioides posadasii C735 delta SOWgp]KMP08407.1 hypothetical protein CIRG_08088 [Coccidioides immitis RMSCC 2394]TPX20035.1 hypothetical protein DIZ76_017830 [Coccidioides immitis]EAS33117.3 hypothetical protein CIMG_04141 [Coccidioides immitis RS]EER26103.1 SAP domain containing protein [Coccidioides posadasii C735 delta SOWgp]|eukprot:XP_003068248.1 SAP domain containing protein [Coccidioides posadasii C735 delta SOWgp]